MYSVIVLSDPNSCILCHKIIILLTYNKFKTWLKLNAFYCWMQMLPTCTKLGQDKITKKSWIKKVLGMERFLHIIHFYQQSPKANLSFTLEFQKDSKKSTEIIEISKFQTGRHLLIKTNIRFVYVFMELQI